MKKIMSIFKRDFKIAKSDPLALWIFLAPLFFSLIVTLVAPKINDTSVNLVLDKTVSSDFIVKASEIANIDVLDDLDEVKSRVLRRDEVIGITNIDDKLTLVLEGNESGDTVKFANLTISMYNLDLLDIDNIESRLNFYSFNEKIPSLKRSLSISVILMCTVVASMIIALGLIDEKNDNTIKAAEVTPMSITSYIISKSIIGVILLFVSCILSLLILGMFDINWLHMLFLILSIGLLSIIISFVVGLASSDFIEAAANIKITLLPMVLAVLVIELASEKWQLTMFWNPFYYAYKGMSEVINKTSTLVTSLGYSAVICFICLLLFLIVKKNIKKHLY